MNVRNSTAPPLESTKGSLSLSASLPSLHKPLWTTAFGPESFLNHYLLLMMEWAFTIHVQISPPSMAPTMEGRVPDYKSSHALRGVTLGYSGGPAKSLGSIILTHVKSPSLSQTGGK